jgi:hypothetical protein
VRATPMTHIRHITHDTQHTKKVRWRTRVGRVGRTRVRVGGIALGGGDVNVVGVQLDRVAALEREMPHYTTTTHVARTECVAHTCSHDTTRHAETHTHDTHRGEGGVYLRCTCSRCRGCWRCRCR